MTGKNSSEKNKVCHVTSAHSRYDIRIFHKECRSLANNGYDITLLVNDDLPNESINGVKIISTQFKPKNRYERMIKSKRLIRKYMLDIDSDIYHFHDPELLLEASWIKKKGKKVIFDFHEDVSQQILYKRWIPKIVRNIISKLYIIYEKRISSAFNGIIVPTPYLKEKFDEINRRVFQVANFPILEEFNNSVLGDKNIDICYIGGITKDRGIFNVINSVKNTSINFRLAGRINDSELEELIVREDRISYLGYLNRNEISELLQKSRIGIVTLLYTPNHYYSYPIKMFEYMAAGLPVIASNFPLWKDIIEGNNCGICVDPDDIEEIEKAIMYLTSNPEIAIEMGKNGKNIVHKEYNWKKQAQELINCYYLISRGK